MWRSAVQICLGLQKKGERKKQKGEIIRTESFTFNLSSLTFQIGGLAQLARAPALHAGGQRFESVILHARDSILNRSLTYCTIILQANLE